LHPVGQQNPSVIFHQGIDRSLAGCTGLIEYTGKYRVAVPR
jgi:hypothetical protein